ncbi:MAG: hypothetical protein QM734_02930 [Cyclobacteriaceae bacterium]
MILPTMSREEIVDHLTSEYKCIEVRLTSKMNRAFKKLKKFNRSTFTFTEQTKNRTTFTIYVSSAKKGLVTIGAWGQNSIGKFFASIGPTGVSFYNHHFFIRYAERLLKLNVNVEQTAEHFFYKEDPITMYIGHLFSSDGTFNMFAAVYPEGVALGYVVNDQIGVTNTFLTNDMLFPNQRQMVDKMRSESATYSYPVVYFHPSGGNEIRAIEATLEAYRRIEFLESINNSLNLKY